MHRVVSVSFPRSGHHLLERCLRGLFPGEVQYCDYYRHCRHSPCLEARTNLQKCHDFDLRLERAPGWMYVIQYRHPLEAIVSWYEAELRHRHKARPGEPRLRKAFKLTFLQDSEIYWRFFLAKYVRFWRRFVEKWALAPPPGAWLLSYGDLVRQPIDQLQRIAAVVATGEPPGRADVERVVREQRIGERRSIREFRYYDERQFAQIEAGLAEQLTALHLPRLFAQTGGRIDTREGTTPRGSEDVHHG